MLDYGFATEGKAVVAEFPLEVKGRTFLITGPSKGGIGAETASTLALGSCSTIVLLGRSLSKIQPCIDDIHTASPCVKVKFVEIQLDSLASVRAAAKQILDDPEIEKIDVAILNAAIMACPYGTTVDGFETQFGTNHLSHFLLINLLMPKILAAAPGCRVVSVSSWAHSFWEHDFNDPGFSGGKTYQPLKAYSQAKAANILLAVSLNEKLGSRGLHAYALHPGSFASGLQEYWTPEIQKESLDHLAIEEKDMPPRKTLQQGCSTTIRAALDPNLLKQRGVYLHDCNLTSDPDHLAASAVDPGNAEKCWKLSEDLINQRFEY